MKSDNDLIYLGLESELNRLNTLIGLELQSAQRKYASNEFSSSVFLNKITILLNEKYEINKRLLYMNPKRDEIPF